jgi:environmental stress-induced protein Ves
VRYSALVPSLRRIVPAEHRVMPWKNGLGTTTEIAVDPPDATLDTFTLRLSIADLAASGPFSRFPGVDRILVQIEGAPMTLTHEGLGARRLALLAPHRFAGELATHGTLEAPPARDFNVMVRRDRASADLVVHELAPGAVVEAGGDAEARIVYLLRGAASVRADGETVELGASETLIARGASSIAIRASSEGAIAFAVTIGPPGRSLRP